MQTPADFTAKHTPGPWVVFHADEDGPNDVLPAMRPGHIALNIAGAADARLIAAAPELLEMTTLFASVAEYQIRKSRNEGDEEGARLQTLTLNLIRAALAKAGA